MLANRRTAWLMAIMDIKLVRAFIASPGGLEEERRAAFEAAAEVNRSVARPMGARLELIGWEETLSGNGRPQAQINVDMETCELFIGAMWTTWGSRPSLDGQYSSGFEEEFELSRLRHAATGSPHMSLFFKEVAASQLRDPGDELKKVLAFQERLRAEKAFLYDSFSDASQFAGKVREFLTQHVIRILMEARPAVRSQPAQPPADMIEAQGATDTSDARDASSEITPEEVRFVEQIARTLGSAEGASNVEVARLRLIAASAARSGNDAVTVGVHDANLLYEHRAAYHFSYAEKRGLLKVGLATIQDQNVPLWTWLGDLDREQSELLFALSIVGEEAERIGALTAMRLLGRPLSSLKKFNLTMLSRSWFDEVRPEAVKVAAIHYLRDLGTLTELPAVEAEARRGATETVGPALEAALNILLRYDETEAARFLIAHSFETLPGDILTRVLPHLADLGSNDLGSGLDHRAPAVRARAIDLLAERGGLQLETIERARDDDTAIVRAAAMRALDRLDQPLSLDEARTVIIGSKRRSGVFGFFTPDDPADEPWFDRFRTARLATMSPASVKILLGSEQHRDAAYRVLARRHIENYADRLRADLKDGFHDYFAQHWPKGITASPRSGLGLLSADKFDPADMKRRELTKAALHVVAEQRDAADLPLVRYVLDEQRLAPSPELIAYLRSLGDESDITRLAKTPLYTWLADEGDGRAPFDAAVAAIRRLAVCPFADLLARELPETIKASLLDQASWADVAALRDDMILSLLLTNHEGLRRSTARKVAASLPRRRIVKILAAYRADEEGRFYLVTHWLDLGVGLPQRAARQVVQTAVRPI